MAYTYTQEDMKKAINEAREQGRKDTINNIIGASVTFTLLIAFVYVACVLF